MTDQPKKAGGFLTDHQGKPSNIRIVSLMSAAAGIVLALAPLWGGPPPEFQTLIILLLGMPGIKVWQSVAAEKNQFP